MKSIVLIIPKYKFTAAIIVISLLLIFSTSYMALSIFIDKNVLGGKTIVVDAGHGGVDGGTSSRNVLEKDINLEVSLKLQGLLEGNGAKVIMTRTEDKALSKSTKINRARYIEDLNTRVDIINNSKANIFVSIHTNSNVKKPSTRGAIAFFYNSHPHNREMAYIFQNVFNSLSFNYDGREYKSHHIPQKGKFFVLSNAKIPGILIETGFLTNSTDLYLLQNPGYKNYLADAIYRGIINYFLSSDKMPQKIDETIDIEEENMIGIPEEEI